jgi:hypothetical protein
VAFKSERIGQILVWTGDPDCDAAYAALAAHLASTPIPRLPAGQALSPSQRGNLGESLAFLVGRTSTFPSASHRLLADNCANPLAGGSKTGLDVLWMAFHPTDSSADHAWIQEVKTTADLVGAAYIGELKDDYKKLFGARLGLTLEDRLGDAAFKLEHTAGQPDLACRARALGARGVRDATRVSLVPTGVHDLSVEALSIIEDVRITLIEELGWHENQVEPMLIGLSQLGARLAALVR